VDYGGLKTEIAKPAYSGMSDDQIVAQLNAPIAGPGVGTPISAILAYLRQNNLWLSIKANAASTAPNVGALAAVDLFNDPHTASINLTSPAAQALLADLVTGGLLTQAQANALTALSQTTTSLAANYGFANGVTVAELAAARIWPGVSTA
jgi:hypothetical protein